MQYIMDLRLDEFCELVVHASEKIRENQIRSQWEALLPFMMIKWLKYVPFQEYLESCTGATFDARPKEEIIREIMELHGMKEL